MKVDLGTRGGIDLIKYIERDGERITLFQLFVKTLGGGGIDADGDGADGGRCQQCKTKLDQSHSVEKTSEKQSHLHDASHLKEPTKCDDLECGE
jgi:hypothetical protein